MKALAARFELGGLTGIIASLLGKGPPDLRYWLVTGDVPRVGEIRGRHVLERTGMAARLDHGRVAKASYPFIQNGEKRLPQHVKVPPNIEAKPIVSQPPYCFPQFSNLMLLKDNSNFFPFTIPGRSLAITICIILVISYE